MTAQPDYALAVHGGAGAKPGRDYHEVETHLAHLIRRGESMLTDGAPALDTVEAMVTDMETSGLYVAGRGSAPNAAGYVEMDAAIMDGHAGRAGAVAGVRDVRSPVEAARAVLDRTPHVLLAGVGADHFCAEAGIERISDPQTWYRLPVGVERSEIHTDALAHGTVGAVALDAQGRLAAATSTGGLFGKREGRIGDTPLIGSGTWADTSVGVSCTGLGEYFMLSAVAHDVSARLRYAGAPLWEAVNASLNQVAERGGDGGLIAIDRQGEIVTDYNSQGMKRASVKSGKPVSVRIF
ncbi:MAG: isoaspartyl peptidase/L-asparaginase [Hyphomonadaceae bacterium]|nr:isoaspartyl peptidase/L-asparaginase [Hyphomonadaceae bacterium]